MEPILKRMGLIDISMYDRYAVGDYVKVIHGALEGTEGKIISIDKTTGNVMVETSSLVAQHPLKLNLRTSIRFNTST